MTSYERVKLALDHKEPDKIPFDLGGSVLTGMNITCYKNLRQFLGLPNIECRVDDVTQQLAHIDEDMIDLLKVDVRRVDPGVPTQSGFVKKITREGNYYKYTDEWGIGWRMPVDGGHYYDMCSQPLADCEEIEDLADYKFPNPLDEGRFVNLKKHADDIVYNQQRAYILGRMCAGIWEMALWTNGFEKFFCDMVVNESYAHHMMERITDIKMKYWEQALATVGDNVLIVSEADDLATQISTMVSMDMYKNLVSPYHKKLFDHIKKVAKVPVKIFYHSCGAVKDMIPLLIDEGVDILNPVQVSATGMDTAELKKQFGKHLSFWGGGVDTQLILPKGTVQQVKDETKRRIDDLRKDGGFIFNPVHNVQSDVPPENYYAMWETLQKHGGY